MECWCSHQDMILSGTFPGLLKQSLCKAFKSSTFPFEIWYSTAKKKISDKYFTLHQISEITTLNQIPWNIYINVHEQKLLCDTINCLWHVPTYTIITQNFISITKTDHLLSISHLDNQKKENQGKFISIHTPEALDLLRAQSPSLSPDPSPTSNFLDSFGTTSCMLRRSTFFFSLLLPDSIITGRSKRPAVCKKLFKT